MDQTPVALEAVLANAEFNRRPVRRPDDEAERRALLELAKELGHSPRHVLRKLSDAAMQLCRAGSAGISLLEEENGRKLFRWHAASGEFAGYLWSTMPRECSPCGTVLDRDATLLMRYPERHFTPLRELRPQIVEVLLVPFYSGAEAVGTLWVVSHDENRAFDVEDRRVVASLARFASTAYARLSFLTGKELIGLAAAGGARRPGALQKRVLIVDDNVDAADSLLLLLKDTGHIVTSAHDGHSALRIARSLRPDVVLLDIGLPGLDGYQVARQLRQEFGAQMVIVAVTGLGSDPDRESAIEAGFDYHLLKPVEPSFFESLLKNP
jgi:CheY-like chemotaxis protein